MLCVGIADAYGQAKGPRPYNYEVAVYYFPNYHRDAANERWHGRGWTEWALVKAAKLRFPGHRQPIVPAWGYFDESGPKWAAKEIDLAANHGVDVFIYDWYRYEAVPGNKYPYGQENGFLKHPTAAGSSSSSCGPTTTGSTSTPPPLPTSPRS